MRSPHTRVRPSLEHLEDRTVPATVRLVSGDLLVSNLLIVGNRASVTIQATANNSFQVVDTEGGTGSASLGTYTVAGNIIVSGTNANDSITVNLNGHAYSGNLLINGGNGNDSVIVTGAGAGNVIGGNVTLLHAAGNESVSLNPTTSSALTIGGSVTAVNTTSAFSNFALGNASATTTVGGNVTLTNFSDNSGNSAVQIGEGQYDQIGGSLTVQSPTDNNVSVTLGKVVAPADGNTPATNPGLAIGVSIGKDFTVTAGSGNDSVTFLGAKISTGDLGTGAFKSPNVGTTIGGNTYVQLGDGNDAFNVAGTANPAFVVGGQETTFDGNVTYIAGNGNDSITLASMGRGIGVGTTIFGNLTINLGSGNNDFGSDIIPGVGGNLGLEAYGTTVDGNLSLTSGNGNNVMQYYGLLVQGNAAFHFGNGNNGTTAAPIVIRRPPGGQLTYTTGNGNNYLDLFTPLNALAPDVLPFVFDLNVHFGNGDDTFQLGDPFGGAEGTDQGGIVTGTVDGGGRITANDFIQNAALWTLSPTFTLSNFP